MAGIIEEVLADGSREMGINLDPGCLGLFREYYRVLEEENEKYNLTSVKGEREVAVKHFLDSLSCLRVADLESGTVFDIGTGAGFPGIPLKICRPGINLLMVDSVKKKVNFVNELIKRLGLEGAEVRWDRAEAMGSAEFREKADVVVSRAVAPLNVLAEICLPLARVGGVFLAMKGPGWENEIKAATGAINLMGGVVDRRETFTLPVIPEERCLIVTRKIIPTPVKYPRRPGIPAKRPIV